MKDAAKVTLGVLETGILPLDSPNAHSYSVDLKGGAIAQEQMKKFHVQDLTLLPGAMGKEFKKKVVIPNLETANDNIKRLRQEFHKSGKWIFSVCHGIQILAAAGLLKGRKVTCYENVRLEVAQAGGKWINKQSVVDGNLVTAQTWESHADFYRDIFRCLEG